MRRSLSGRSLSCVLVAQRSFRVPVWTAREGLRDFGKSSGSLRLTRSDPLNHPLNPLRSLHIAASAFRCRKIAGWVLCACVGHHADYRNDLSSSLQIRNDNLLLITHNPLQIHFLLFLSVVHWCALDRNLRFVRHRLRSNS